tara:strand:+ start:19487 stop:20524 length:1038 start_codon:yes stop_codon:yes gene_type:complete
MSSLIASRNNSVAKILITVAVTAIILIPNLTFAQGFVPCDGTAVNGGTACTECNLVQMGNTILIWLIGILFLLFAFMVFVAGWGFITSGGNPSARDAAKSKLTNALIGLLIVLAAWLIVDTMMRALLSGGTGTITGYGPWQQVQCGAMTTANFVAAQPYTSVTTAPQACGGPSEPSCASLVSDCTAIGGTPVTTPTTVSCTTATGIASSTATVGACDTTQMTTISLFNRSATVDNRLVPSLQAIDAAWQAQGSGRYDVRSLGTYNCRQVTGGTNYSYHAYGFAIDVNPAQNPYGSKVTPCPSDMPASFVNLFTSRGYGWGGNWSSLCDAMHFSAASGEGGWLPRP